VSKPSDWIAKRAVELLGKDGSGAAYPFNAGERAIIAFLDGAHGEATPSAEPWLRPCVKCGKLTAMSVGGVGDICVDCAYPPKPSAIIRSGDLEVGRRYRIVALARGENRDSRIGDIVTCVRESADRKAPGNCKIDHQQYSGQRRGWYSGDSLTGVYVTAVELVEEEQSPQAVERPIVARSTWRRNADQALVRVEHFGSDIVDIINLGNGFRGPRAEAYLRAYHTWVSDPPPEPADPTIIRAAEGVTLEPGEYEEPETGYRWTLTAPNESRISDGGWAWAFLRDGERHWVTAVRRIESSEPRSERDALVQERDRLWELYNKRDAELSVARAEALALVEGAQRERDEALAELSRSQEVERGLRAPIPMRLPCPQCRALHIDEGDFATKPHHTHACQACGEVWRPAVVATVGVRFLPGFKNEGPDAAATGGAKP